MSTQTARDRVLDTLADGRWHDGYDLCHPSIGGSEGLRRLRDLRAEGHQIEKRLKPGTPGSSRVYQYRLIPTETLFATDGLEAPPPPPPSYL